MTQNEVPDAEEHPFEEIINMIVPEFADFTFEVKDFCKYYRDLGKVCPLIKADHDPNRKFKHLFNWEPSNCMWLCSWFEPQDLPALAKRMERLVPK